MRSPLRPHSLRTGAAVAFGAYGALACAVLLGCLAYLGERLAIRTASEKALAIAGIAALSVDRAAHLRVQASDDRQALERVSYDQSIIWAAAPRVATLYTLMPKETGGGWRYVTVYDLAGHAQAHPGDPIVAHYRPLLERALGKAIADDQPYTDARGMLVRAYAPVRGPDGRAIAVVAAEVAVPIAALLRDARWIALGAVLALICFGVVIGLWRGGSIVRALQALTAASDRLARGHVVEPLSVRGTTEICQLTQTFNRMVAAMADRAHDANTDGLTGLYNHRYFRERLAQEVARASRYGHRVALLMIDIDHFKRVNDRYGHPAGDDILQQVAAAIRGAIRDIDVAARYGGEEFVVIMPEADSFTGVEQAELVRLAVRRHHYQIKTDESLNHRQSAAEEPEVNISIGIAECPANASDPESFVMAADSGLLRAKQMGRDRVCAYQSVDVIEGEGDCRELHRLIHKERAALRQAQGHPSASVGASPEQRRGAAPPGSAVDREPFTCARCCSVTRYAMTLAHALGLPKREAEEVRRAALWVDVNRSKDGQPKETAPDTLAAEIAASRSATAEGLMNRTFRASSVPANVMHRHEWYNGHGYPDGLAGDEIPLVARMLAIAETYERLLAGNGDVDPLPPAEALRGLEGRAGTQLDPGLVATFVTAIEAEAEAPSEVACAARSLNGEEEEEDQPVPSPQEITGAARMFAD